MKNHLLEIYDIKNIQGHYEAYKDGEFICSGDTMAELEAELVELEKEDSKNKYIVTWVVTNNDDNAVHKSLEVEAKDEHEAMAMVTDKNVRDVKAVKLESFSSFALDFSTYENLWS